MLTDGGGGGGGGGGDGTLGSARKVATAKIVDPIACIISALLTRVEKPGEGSHLRERH
jgi:hypothetical protein